jgi:hypothetical protein
VYEEKKQLYEHAKNVVVPPVATIVAVAEGSSDIETESPAVVCSLLISRLNGVNLALRQSEGTTQKTRMRTKTRRRM